jgi:hypothetical protein
MNPIFLALNPGVIALMIPIISVISAACVFIIFRSYAHRERLAMIENGLNPKDLQRELKSEWLNAFSKYDPHRFIRIACTLIGVGVGLFFGNMLRAVEQLDKGGTVAGMICICGGLGLLMGHFLQMSVSRKYPVTSQKNEMDI